MTEFKPTHFIEQYNVKDEYKTGANWYSHSPYYNIDMLQNCLKDTAETVSLHTVAVFKIQFKNDDKNNS